MTDQTKLLNEAGIASLLGVRREYVRDRLVKRPDFPPPALVLSQRIRRWSEGAVLKWVQDQSPA